MKKRSRKDGVLRGRCSNIYPP